MRAGDGADAELLAEPRALRHQRPERRWGLTDVGRVVFVGQAEIVAELVAEHAVAAVFGVAGVGTGPDAVAAETLAVGAGHLKPPLAPGPWPLALSIHQLCAQMASSPWTPPPADWSAPAWMTMRWSMMPSGWSALPGTIPNGFFWSYLAQLKSGWAAASCGDRVAGDAPDGTGVAVGARAAVAAVPRLRLVEGDPIGDLAGHLVGPLGLGQVVVRHRVRARAAQAAVRVVDLVRAAEQHGLVVIDAEALVAWAGPEGRVVARGRRGDAGRGAARRGRCRR